MQNVKVTNQKDARNSIKSRKFKKVELAYELNSDDFFELATVCCQAGDKIKKGDDYFTVTLKL